MYIYLNIFITKLVRDLQQKYVGRHTRKILYSTTRDAHYKDKYLHMVYVYMLL